LDKRRCNALFSVDKISYNCELYQGTEIGYSTVFDNLTTKKRRERNEEIDPEQIGIYYSMIVQLMCKKKETAFVKLEDWLSKAVDHYQWADNDIKNDDQLLKEFPIRGITDAAVIERLSSNVDSSNFFNTEEINLEVTNKSCNFLHLRTTPISVRVIQSCLHPEYLNGEAISLITSYLFRNYEKTNQFLLWPANTLKYLFDMDSRVEVKTMNDHCAVYLSIYNGICGKGKKSKKKQKKNVWLSILDCAV
jgi:hypothetical protein